jgi:DNA-binding response OmpR family regulator
MSAQSRFNLSEIKVFVIDDNLLTSEILAQIFLGFHAKNVKKVGTIAEAKEALSAEKFNLIIVDEKLFCETGLSLAKWIRRDPLSLNETVPVILASANTTKALVDEARNAGTNYIVLKPYVPAVLLERIEYLAKNNRHFIKCEAYVGPDRRFVKKPLPAGVEERRAETLRLLEGPSRTMSQDEVSSLFG